MESDARILGGVEVKMVGLPRVNRQAPLWGLTMMSRGYKEVKMVGLPRLELGTCGAKEWSRMLASSEVSK